MTDKTRRHKRILGIVLAIVIAVGTVGGVIGYNSFKSNAAYDTSKAITFKELNGKKPIADKYFFVGTYVFALDAITDEMYDKALSSQSEFNQFNNYYKSELAGGVWYDITDATDLKYITSTGTPIDQSQIDPLYVTVYIDENGKAFNAKDLAPISLYDLPSPYDLKQIPELNTLYSMYQAMFSEESRGVDKFYYEQLTEFFNTDFRTKYPKIAEQTNSLDRRISNLEKGYQGLQEMGETEKADALDDLMYKVDCTRRAVIYKQLAVESILEGSDDYELNMLLQVLSNKSADGKPNIDDKDEIEQSTLPYDVWTNNKKQYTYDQIYKYMEDHGESDDDDDDDDEEKSVPLYSSFLKGTKFEGATSDKEPFKMNEGIISTLYDADSDCKTTYDDMMANAIAVSNSHIGKAITDTEMALYDECDKGYTVSLIALVERLVRYNNIADNVVKEKSEELALINDGLFAACENGFKSAATGGVGNAYQSALSQGANEDGLASALDDQEAELTKEMTELQFIITAKKMRINTKLCFEQTLGWIDWTDALLKQVPDDAFASRAKMAINSHKAWLTDLLKQLAKEDSSLQSELDKLMAQKDALNEEKKKYLDSNDLNGAKKVDAKLTEIDKLIDEEAAKQSDVINNEDASASDKAAAAVGMAGTTEGAVQDLKNAAMDKIANGEDASDELNALGQLGADDALSEIGANNSNKDNNSGKDKDKGKYSLSENEIMSILADLLGGEFSTLSAEGKVIAAVAVDRYGELGNVPAQNISKNLIEICATERNRFVYDTYTDGGKEFVSLSALGKASDYRYVYSAGGKEGTLAEGKDSYSFTNGEKEMSINSTKTSNKMSSKAVYKYGSLYIPEATVNEYFEHSSEAIDKASYSAVLNKSMDAKVKEVLEALKNGGNE